MHWDLREVRTLTTLPLTQSHPSHERPLFVSTMHPFLFLLRLENKLLLFFLSAAPRLSLDVHPHICGDYKQTGLGAQVDTRGVGVHTRHASTRGRVAESRRQPSFPPDAGAEVERAPGYRRTRTRG